MRQPLVLPECRSFSLVKMTPRRKEFQYACNTAYFQQVHLQLHPNTCLQVYTPEHPLTPRSQNHPQMNPHTHPHTHLRTRMRMRTRRQRLEITTPSSFSAGGLCSGGGSEEAKMRPKYSQGQTTTRIAQRKSLPGDKAKHQERVVCLIQLVLILG